jgi:hypothetical protein
LLTPVSIIVLNCAMELRCHPLMSHRGLSTWPPTWVWRGGNGNAASVPKGEIGILKEVLSSLIEPRKRLFLIVEHNGEEYMGCLIVDDMAFCQQLEKLLRQFYNRPIAEIGSIDLTLTL